MTDKAYETAAKRYHHKKKFKSKFANGFRNIFHQPKMQRSSSVPTHLDDEDDRGGNTLYPRITYDIDISNENLSKTGNNKSALLTTSVYSQRPSSAYFPDFGSSQELSLSPDKNGDVLPTFPMNHGWRKSFTSLDYFRKDKSKPSDIVRAKHKLHLQENGLNSETNNKEVVIANSPHLLNSNNHHLPDANNNTDHKNKLTLQKNGSSEVHSSLESVKEVDISTPQEQQQHKQQQNGEKHLHNGHADPNIGINGRLSDPNITDINIKSPTEITNKRRGIMTSNKAVDIPDSTINHHNKPPLHRATTCERELNSALNELLSNSPERNENSNVEINLLNRLKTSTPNHRAPMTRSLTDEVRVDQNGVNIPRTYSDNMENLRKKAAFTIEKEKLQTLIEDVIENLLIDKTYDVSLVTRWCKEICVKVRDRLLRVKELRHKIVVNAHIAAKLQTEGNVDTIFVATRCQKDSLNDSFITVALEGKDLYVWVTVLLVKYR